MPQRTHTVPHKGCAVWSPFWAAVLGPRSRTMKWPLPWPKASVTSRWYLRGFTHGRVEATLWVWRHGGCGWDCSRIWVLLLAFETGCGPLLTLFLESSHLLAEDLKPASLLVIKALQKTVDNVGDFFDAAPQTPWKRSKMRPCSL